jgi:hypothetical protein
LRLQYNCIPIWCLNTPETCRTPVRNVSIGKNDMHGNI